MVATTIVFVDFMMDRAVVTVFVMRRPMRTM